MSTVTLAQQGEAPVSLLCDIVGQGPDGAWVEVTAALAYDVVDGRKSAESSSTSRCGNYHFCTFNFDFLTHSSAESYEKIGFSCCYICLLPAMGDHH